MSSSAIAVSGLRKAFGDKVVLDGIDFEVAAGIGLLPARPERGGQDDDGERADDVDDSRRRDGARRRARRGDRDQGGALGDRRDRSVRRGGRAAVGPGEPAADGGPEAVCLPATRWSHELLERFDLVESADKMASTYSGGMRRKLDLAMTLVGNPQIIFLDEPTTGLDPRSRRTMWDIVRGLVADGVTIFLTTQYLDEADQLADRIAVLDQGRLVAQGTSRRPQAPDPRQPRPAPVHRRLATRRGRAGLPRLHAGRRDTDSAGSQRRRDEFAAGPAGPARRVLDSAPKSSPCTRPISTTSSSP